MAQVYVLREPFMEGGAVLVLAVYPDTPNLSDDLHGDRAVRLVQPDANVIRQGGGWSLAEGWEDALKGDLLARVDAAAENARLRYITAGAGQAMTYQEKFAELVRYEADSSPVKAEYPMLSAEIGITGSSLGAVAAAVRAAYDIWKKVGGEIEVARLRAKADIDKASTPEAAMSAASVEWPSA